MTRTQTLGTLASGVVVAAVQAWFANHTLVETKPYKVSNSAEAFASLGWIIAFLPVGLLFFAWLWRARNPVVGVSILTFAVPAVLLLGIPFCGVQTLPESGDLSRGEIVTALLDLLVLLVVVGMLTLSVIAVGARMGSDDFSPYRQSGQ